MNLQKSCKSESEMAVSIRNISKKYRLFSTPKERLFEALHPFRKRYHKEFWALKEISFDVPRGTTVGLIGRNGSGKSTLLQIICSILRPTSGKVIVNGKISALLELGAGFNQDLTGRQNVILNGEIHGFTRNEMLLKMKLIEDFADIGEFIDQPVKTYSTGMFVRLAFASAINIEPDILVVDEALAVGDAKFQNKCFNKFREFQESGRTIIFVTHDMNAVAKHCNYGFLFDNGMIIKSGKPTDVINHYYELILSDNKKPNKKLNRITGRSNDKKDEDDGRNELEKFFGKVPDTDCCALRKSYNKNELRFGDKRGELLDYLVISENEYDPVAIHFGDTIEIYLKAVFYKSVKYPLFGFSIKTLDGVVVYASNTRCSNFYIDPVNERCMIIFQFKIEVKLNRGDYFLDLGIAEKLNEKDEPIDIRYNLAHLVVTTYNKLFDGFVELDSHYQEVSRRTL